MKRFVTTLIFACLASAAAADGGHGHTARGAADRSAHDRARDAVARHAARPLSEILPEIERRYRARMVEVELEDEDGRLAYEIKLVTDTGRLIEVVVDAATGAVVKDDTGKGSFVRPEE